MTPTTRTPLLVPDDSSSVKFAIISPIPGSGTLCDPYEESIGKQTIPVPHLALPECRAESPERCLDEKHAYAIGAAKRTIHELNGHVQKKVNSFQF